MTGLGLGAAFLMANSSIGPGFLTQTSFYTEQLLTSFGFVILISIILFFFTRLAFSYERRWYVAQLRIQESLQFKDRIVSMISHEIRSPLSIVSIYSKFLSSKIKDKDLVSVFDSLQFTTNSLQTLSNQILEFSKNEREKMVLNVLFFVLILVRSMSADK